MQQTKGCENCIASDNWKGFHFLKHTFWLEVFIIECISLFMDSTGFSPTHILAVFTPKTLCWTLRS